MHSESAQAIKHFITAIATNAIPFATAMAAVGILTMAIVQTVKDMFPVRNLFQRRFVAKWFERKAAEAPAMPGATLSPDEAENDLIRLSTAGDRKAFYDLAIEQLCGQINAATQVLFDYPHEHRDLLRCLASLARVQDLQRLLTPPQGAGATRTQDDVDARARVMHQVQRSIDALQIAAGFQWKLCLQIASFLLSYIFVIAGLSLYLSPSQVTAKSVAAIVITGIVGGFVAPVARDLVASLESLRK